MNIVCEGHPFAYEMTCLTMLFFPGEKMNDTDSENRGERYLYTGRQVQGTNFLLKAEIRVEGETLSAEEQMDAALPESERESERRLAVLAYCLFARCTGKTPPWGILTGVRPVKLLQRAVDSGLSEEEVRRRFREEYLISPEKLDLAMAARRMEHLILGKSTGDSFSLYISIPFCPSRCLYCSFVSHSIEKTYKLIDPYVDQLCEEIALTARLAKEVGLTLRTVYFGGGTPTAITAEQLRRITDCVAANFDLSQLWEYTIEAGRPDTITREKLQVIKDAGVGRISINPQTLSDEVLAFVGRKHTAQDLVDCYHLAREMGFDSINMDLIAGLPTDTLEGFKASLDGVIALAPENITVHTLSVKRAADLAGAQDDLGLRRQAEQVGAMVDYSQQALTAAGYGPYYLYRQKNTLDNLENTGWCRPGTEGLYNVYIMDETHTILACGAGAVSKLRQPDGPQITRIFNYKYPYEYLSRFDQMAQRKEQVREFYERYPYHFPRP